MPRQPNLLLIMTDQQRFDTIHAAGNPQIVTPQLDRLCATGVRFDRAYCEMPECVPARSMVLTGQWGHQTGVMANGKVLSQDRRTFVHALGEAGYHCQAIGKMHFSPVRAAHGFHDLSLMEEIPITWEEDDFLQYLRSVGYDWVHEPHGIRHERYYLPQVSQLPDEHHGTTWVGDQTVEFIRNAGTQPFFLFSSFIKPHPPFEPTIPYLTLYDPEAMPLPWRAPFDREDAWPLHKMQTYSKWMELTDDNLARQIKAAYYACITQVDAQVGRILDALEEAGRREDTLVVFVSDHGELLGDHYQWGKRAFYEGAARVPFILSQPGTLPEGVVRPQLVGHRDLAATFLAAAGVSMTDELAGEDLLPQAMEDTLGRELTFGELFEGPRAIYMALRRDDQGRAEWKYAYMPNGGLEHLFYLIEDPREMINRAYDPECAGVNAELQGALVEFFRREGYAAALNPAGDGLRLLPHTPLRGQRNRQYAQWKPVQKPPTVA